MACYRCGAEGCEQDDCAINRVALLQILQKLPPVTDEQVQLYKRAVAHWSSLSERERLEAWSIYVQIRANVYRP